MNSSKIIKALPWIAGGSVLGVGLPIWASNVASRRANGSTTAADKMMMMWNPALRLQVAQREGGVNAGSTIRGLNPFYGTNTFLDKTASYGADGYMDKEAAALARGMWNAGKAAWNATRGARMLSAKDAFTAATKGQGHNTQYNIGRILYNMPQRVGGTMLYGDWGAGAGAKWLGKRLGATGDWVVKNGKPVWEWNANKVAPGSQSWLQRAGNKLYGWGDKGVRVTDRAAEKAKAAADEIANSGGAGKWMLGKGLKWGTSVGIAAPLASIVPESLSSAALGDDHIVTKAIGGVSRAMDMPFQYLNPAGLVFTGAEKGISWAGNKVRDVALNAAEQSAHMTAEELAQGIQDKGRLAFLYGAISPEAYTAKLRAMAHQSIADRIAAERAANGL